MSKIEEITSLEVLQEKRNEAAKRINEMRELFNSRGDDAKKQPGEWQGEEKGQWDEVNADFESITSRMKKLTDSAEVEKQWQASRETARRSHREVISDPNAGQLKKEITPEVRNLAFQGWLRRRSADSVLTDGQRDAMKMCKIYRNANEVDFKGLNTSELRKLQKVARRTHRDLMVEALDGHFEKRAMGTGAGVGGEYIPEGFIRQVEVNMLSFSGVMQAGSIVRTASGNDIPWPTFDDTGNTGRLIPEADPVTDTADPTTAAIVLNAYKFTSDEILVAYELLEDEDLSPELPAILAAALGERLGRIKESFYTTGTGTAQPQGIVTGSGLGVTAASATAITSDEIIALEHSVDPAYRSGASYMMHDDVILAVRLLKDLEGRYYWQPGLQMGTPDRLNGRQVFTNQQMADTLEASAKVALFGDMTKMKIREVNNVRMYRLIERHRENDQDAFLAFSRGDSKLLNAGTSPINHLIMAAA